MLTTKDEKLPEKSGVGVIVARFQVAELTTGHRQLIESVIARHDRVIVILGSNGAGSSTENNPLDFRTRQLMITDNYPIVEVGNVADCKGDELWSRCIDNEIRVHTTIGSKITLYGGRDSFAKYYSGSYEVKVLESESDSSGTKARDAVRERANKSSPEFRQGVIWANKNRYPTTYPVIDVAIINESANMILLGKKENETLWRLPGGFVDPKKGFANEALEDTVRREAMEETNLEVSNIEYVGSYFVDDWRYQGEVDSMMSILFKAVHGDDGLAKAGDDLVAVNWFPLTEATINDIGPKSHKKMFAAILKTI